MPNTMPSPHALDEQMDHLLSDYVTLKGKSGIPDERKNLIQLICSFQCAKDTTYNYKAALGIYVYGIYKIASEYKFLSAEKRSYLLQLLKKSINIETFTPLDDQEAVTYLGSLYHHLNKYPRKIDGTKIHSVDEEKILISDVANQIKICLARLLKKKPTMSALNKNFIKIAEEYKPRSSFLGFGGPNARRNRDVQFIKVLNDYANMRYPLPRDEKCKAYIYRIQYSALLYVMSRIESEYNYMSPDYSSLYRACQRAACINNTVDIDEELKKAYERELTHFITRAEEFPAWQSTKLESALVISKEMTKISTQTYFQRFCNYALESGFQYGVNVTVGAATAGLLSQYQMSAVVISQIGRTIAPQYSLLLHQLVPILNNQFHSYVIKIAKRSATALIIEPLGRPIVILTFSSMASLFRLLASFVKQNQVNTGDYLLENPEFLKTLGTLPNTIFNEADKLKMKYIVGFEKNQATEKQFEKSTSIKLSA